jgi:Squalene-hopene cyclase C-terminal domain
MLLLRHSLLQLLIAGAALVGCGAQALAQATRPLQEKATPAETARRSERTGTPLDAQARHSAELAIPYIEKYGTAWINERNCMACHYAGYMLWSLRDASQRGFGIDKGKLAEATNWAISQTDVYGFGYEGAAQMLIARDRSDLSEHTVERIDAMRDLIIKGQKKDGSWAPGGQLPGQKRPLSETKHVSTMLCILGLESLEQPSQRAVACRDKGLMWLKKTPPNGQKPPVSSEWYATRLLIEKRFGDSKQVEAIREQILAAQQPDGGWGWLRADKSDAFGTGVSVYALSQVGVPNSHPAIRNAWKFLIETQTADGSWIVSGTKNDTKGKPHPLSSFWGSTWALLGLCHSLSVSNPPGNQAHACGS